MEPSGLAHDKCGAQSLSINAPEGTTKLIAVKTHIQYLVVALALLIDVSRNAAKATKEANRRWILA
jgi:hypothetical protein